VKPKAVDLARKAARLSEPEEGLAAVAALRAHLDSLEAQHVENAVRAGLPWRRIASLLGVTRQAAHKRHAAALRAKKEGRPSSGRQLATTEQARHAVSFARQEARSMGHLSVGPEHLLLGLLRDDRGPAVEVLEGFGVSFAAARREVRRLYGEVDEAGSGAPSSSSEPPISIRARAILEQSLRTALRARAGQLGAEHILVALARDSQGEAARVLAALGIAPGEVERELESRIETVGSSEQMRARPKERSVAEKRELEELTEEELDTEIGAALPDRELMSILSVPDPSGGVLLPIPHHQFDPEFDPQSTDAEENDAS
jgi:ClpA/ClpB-like protein